jgi:hypothetical protein
MSTRSLLTVVLVTFLGLASGRAAQSSSTQPQQHQHEHPIAKDKGSEADQKHDEEVNKHGDMAMGFSHMKTTHHFRLTPNGGFIQVQANDPKDIQSRDQIRMPPATYIEGIQRWRFLRPRDDAQPRSARCAHPAAAQV